MVYTLAKTSVTFEEFAKWHTQKMREKMVLSSVPSGDELLRQVEVLKAMIIEQNQSLDGGVGGGLS